MISSTSTAKNFANVDLSFSGDRSHDLNGNDLEITGTSGSFKMHSSTGRIQILDDIISTSPEGLLDIRQKDAIPAVKIYGDVDNLGSNDFSVLDVYSNAGNNSRGKLAQFYANKSTHDEVLTLHNNFGRFTHDAFSTLTISDDGTDAANDYSPFLDYVTARDPYTIWAVEVNLDWPFSAHTPIVAEAINLSFTSTDTTGLDERDIYAKAVKIRGDNPQSISYGYYADVTEAGTNYSFYGENGTIENKGPIIVNDTSYFKFPVGTTSQRGSSPELGWSRVNSDSTGIEWYNGSGWELLSDDGASDTNIGNTNITFNGVRDHDLVDNTLTFDGNGGSDILVLDGDGRSVGISGATNSHVALAVGGTEGIKIPSGTNLERPVAPSAGMMRNTSTAQTFEGYMDGEWRAMQQSDEIVTTATGVTVVVYKNTFIAADMAASAQTLTLDPTDLATGAKVTVLVTNSNNCTLDSDTGNFISTSANTATVSLTEGAYLCTWTGTNWYIITLQ